MIGLWRHTSARFTRDVCGYALAHCLWLLLAFVAMLVLVQGSARAVFALKPHMGDAPVLLGLTLVAAEYVALLFVRSAATCIIYPRLMYWGYIAVICYYIASPYPPIVPIMGAYWFASLALPIALLMRNEARALEEGRLSVDVPREYGVSVPLPAGSALDAPPPWSAFLPLGHRFAGPYEATVPAAPLPRVARQVRAGAGR